MTHAHTQQPVAKAPGLIRFPEPIVNFLLRLGVPLGPNVLITVRGRKTGAPRTQPLAIVSGDSRRWLIGTFGDTNWCRNLRVNPDVVLRRGRHVEELQARELDQSECVAFFTSELPRVLAQMSLPLRIFGRGFLRVVASDIRADPRGAAATHPVFELIAGPSATGQTA